MKHKHYDMICAKAANMDLVMFGASKNGGSLGNWVECNRDTMPKDNENCEYFLCLPQHKEACLHWLNNGEIELNSQYSDEWEEYEPIRYWSLGSVFMRDDYQLRIKPKKEKLWIAVKTDKHEHLGGCRKVRICSHAFVNKSDAEEYLDLSDSQLIEIEVEVVK